MFHSVDINTSNSICLKNSICFALSDSSLENLKLPTPIFLISKQNASVRNRETNALLQTTKIKNTIKLNILISYAVFEKIFRMLFVPLNPQLFVVFVFVYNGFYFQTMKMYWVESRRLQFFCFAWFKVFIFRYLLELAAFSSISSFSSVSSLTFLSKSTKNISSSPSSYKEKKI